MVMEALDVVVVGVQAGEEDEGVYSEGCQRLRKQKCVISGTLWAEREKGCVISVWTHEGSGSDRRRSQGIDETYNFGRVNDIPRRRRGDRQDGRPEDMYGKGFRDWTDPLDDMEIGLAGKPLRRSGNTGRPRGGPGPRPSWMRSETGPRRQRPEEYGPRFG